MKTFVIKVILKLVMIGSVAGVVSRSYSTGASRSTKPKMRLADILQGWHSPTSHYRPPALFPANEQRNNWRRDWVDPRSHLEPSYNSELQSLQPFAVGQIPGTRPQTRRSPQWNKDAIYYGHPPPSTPSPDLPVARRHDEVVVRASLYPTADRHPPFYGGPSAPRSSSYPENFFDQYDLFRHQVNNVGVGLYNTRPDAHQYYRDIVDDDNDDDNDEKHEEEETPLLVTHQQYEQIPEMPRNVWYQDYDPGNNYIIGVDTPDIPLYDDFMKDFQVRIDNSNNWNPMY